MKIEPLTVLYKTRYVRNYNGNIQDRSGRRKAENVQQKRTEWLQKVQHAANRRPT